MSRLYYVSCDGCGKPCGDGEDLKLTASDARLFAKQQGWLHVPRRTAAAGGSPGADYCPACSTI
jgi:hypothetical protein